ncbi:GspH/FimT family pseudopilin [Parahaliea mediterranea]|nr:GspH/FimT family protein [Parahaliea mediterranea]
MFPQSRRPGFTLVELLAVVAVVAITLFWGLPSFSRLVTASQLRFEAARIQRAVNLARSEAVSRNTPVTICPSPYATSGALECGEAFGVGWIVFSNRDRDDEFDAGTDKLLRAFGPMPDGFRVMNKAGTKVIATELTYWADGASRRNLTFMVCPPSGVALDSWSVVINLVGRPRLAKGWGTC